MTTEAVHIAVAVVCVLAAFLVLLKVVPAALVGAVKRIWRARRSRRLLRCKSIMRRIDTMSGVDFELFLADYFISQGYRVEVTQATGDFGADLILRKGRQSIVVQAKRWSSSIGVSSVQQVIAAKQYYKTTDALLVTNSTLTRNAIKLAAGTDVTVWTRNCLMEKFVGGS